MEPSGGNGFRRSPESVGGSGDKAGDDECERDHERHDQRNRRKKHNYRLPERALSALGQH